MEFKNRNDEMQKSEKEKDPYRYIYNPTQANFFMQQGCMCYKTGINSRTNKIFYAFSYEETMEANALFCGHKEKRNKEE